METFEQDFRSWQTPEQRTAWDSADTVTRRAYVEDILFYLELLDLYDTHGVPADLIAVKLREQGIETDEVEMRALFKRLVPARAKIKELVKLAHRLERE